MQTELIPTSLSVSDLNRQARSLLEKSFLMIEVKGEISNFIKSGPGHWYFTLKDEQAQVRCTLFRNRNQFLNYLPKQGDDVKVRAKVSLYEGRGDFQLICDFIEEVGDGKLQLAYHQLKQKLQNEGLLDSAYKQALPKNPQHVGLITSPTGAAVQDILSVLKRRAPHLQVSIYPTQVQGETAKEQIVKAIELANTHAQADVLILSRGGGSLEDLWAFNEEIVARACFASELPIISAIGHEVDQVISDWAADLRAPTPSAAAELVSPDNQIILSQIRNQRAQLQRSLEHYLLQAQAQLNQLSAKLKHPRAQLEQQSQKLDYLTERLTRAIKKSTEQKRTSLQNMASKLNALSPLATLERGYAIVQDAENNIIQNSQTVQIGDSIQTRLQDGCLHAQVTKITKD